MSNTSVDGVHGEVMTLASDPSLTIKKKHRWEERKWVEHRVGTLILRN